MGYPRCTGRRRACPPEDCGGTYGYQEILEGESEYQEHYEEYDPEFFEPARVIFTDPDKQWRGALGGEGWDEEMDGIAWTA